MKIEKIFKKVLKKQLKGNKYKNYVHALIDNSSGVIFGDSSLMSFKMCFRTSSQTKVDSSKLENTRLSAE
ncbi:MAG TPA: hypothetical protein VER35_00545 [Candidatus Limnocylindrales bacterium]|nr:hypothetical protein [Candidatus Limnocylindrales bacterium]